MNFISEPNVSLRSIRNGDSEIVQYSQPLRARFKPKTYSIKSAQSKIGNLGYERVKINPTEALIAPEKFVNFTISYLSYLENVTDNITYDVFESDVLTAHLNIHAETIGPLIPIKSQKITFLCFRDVVETVKHVEIQNTSKCEAKFCFDSDKENELVKISQWQGIIPAESKINLKLTFKPKATGIYFKQIYCLVQFHQPVVLNIIGVQNSKLHLNPKNLQFDYPAKVKCANNYDMYMKHLKNGKILEDTETLMHKYAREFALCLEASHPNSEDTDVVHQMEDSMREDVILTEHFVNMKNLHEISGATSLVNLSKTRSYLYRWDTDSKKNFHVEPRTGVLQPQKRTDFTVYFTTAVPDQLFYADIDLRVFHYDDGSEPISDEKIKLPFTTSLKIIDSFVFLKDDVDFSYELTIPEDMTWVEIKNRKGLIEPMTVCQLAATFKPPVPCEYLDYVQCNIYSVLHPRSTDTKPLTAVLRLIGSCQFGFLVATPNIYDFGECIYGTKSSVKIHVYNFSPAILNFRLYAEYRAFPVGEIEKDVKISPSRGCIQGKGNAEVEITVSPGDIDIFQYALVCQILESDLEDAPPCDRPLRIFSFRFEGVLPTFQVIDLNIENGGPLFSSHLVWQMMSINGFNQVLRTLRPEQKIYFKFPEAMIGSQPITIVLLLKAKMFGEVEWKFEKKVLCSCQEITNNKPLMANRECIHSKAMKISPIKGKLSPNENFPLYVTLSYDTVEECAFQWSLHLPCGRIITLEALVVSLPNDEQSVTSIYMNPTVNLKSIFIGDLDPPVQLFWLYNNTNQPASYIVDKVALREATSNVHRIFDCINPNGIIPPFSCAPLQLLFKPNEIASYSAEFFLCLREDMFVKISLKGEGVTGIEQIKEFSREKTIPERPILKNPKISLELNINLIDIPYIRVFSDVRRLFFLKNTSTTDRWAFRWHNFKIHELLLARVKPVNGIVEPGQSIAMTLVLKTLSHPSSVNLSVPCDVVNYTALTVYESAVKRQKKLDEESADHFIITEKGMSVEMPQIFIPPEPEPSHLFLTINVNIISNVNVDQKLLLQQQLNLKSSKETMPHLAAIVPGNIGPMLPCVQNLLEKLLWNIVNSRSFKYEVKNATTLLDYGYTQIQPKTTLHNDKNLQKMSCVINRNHIQEYLEQILKTIILEVYLENSKLCSLREEWNATVVKLEKDEAKAIVQSKYFDRWSGKYSFSCSFAVKAPSKYGIYVAVQSLNFRVDPKTKTCKDYVKVQVPKKFLSFFSQKIEKTFCGKLEPRESLFLDGSTGFDDVLNNSVVADNGFQTKEDVLFINIHVAREKLKSDEKLDINIVLTAFKHDCQGRDGGVQCRACEWISHKFSMDKIQNCPYTSCLDEDYCRNVDTKNEKRTVVSSGTGTKVSIGAVATIILVLLMFACCVWVSRRMKLWCFNPAGRRQPRMEMNTTDRVPGFEETNTRYGDVIPDTIAPSAPPLTDDKDLPPSYSSLFPGK
ncbi:hypothetical protein RUM44_008343 [Polyplax serrata]|uniref:Uncharacterized protein n=1 Tax=Polyplax serrata TaxID=468196 RepID=A0ABR1B827_POLSC